jgi:hypothetical protein
MNDQDNTNGGKLDSFAQSRLPGGEQERQPMLLGTRGSSQGERQLAIAQARLLSITSLMRQLEGICVGDENGLGESSLLMRVASASDQRRAERLLEEMEEAGVAPSVVVVEYDNAHFDRHTGCFVYGPPV